MDERVRSGNVTQSFGKTAIHIAACRALAMRSKEPLCNDPWAAALAGDEGEALIEEVSALCPEIQPPEHLLVALLAGYLDAHVERYVKVDGFRQVVILGAGLDTRAARLARAGVVYYEVDRAELQEEKLRRLAKLKNYPIDAAVYVGCDIEREDVLGALANHGFSLDEPAVFVLEGLVHLLSDRAVRAILGAIAERCSSRTNVLFNYISDLTDDVVPALDLAIQDGEPLRWIVKNVTLLLSKLGFRHVRTTPFDQLYLGMTGHSCAGLGFIHCLHVARATRALEGSAYLQ
jgi:methyltransferase (TIGR00027 family)